MTALITGASGGIGEVFARELAAKGCHLILVARSKEKLEQLATELSQKHGVKTTVFDADLTLPEIPQYLFNQISKAKLTVDILINNAGFGRCGKFEAVDLHADDKMLMLNIHSLVALTHLFIPGILERKKGGILNVASTAGYQPLPYMAMYGATKAFVLSFTEALWAEYKGKGVRIFCLCPGNTKTNFHEVAGVKGRKVFFPATSEQVVRFGLRLFLQTNRLSAVYGFANQILTLGNRLLPRAWVVLIAKLIYRQS